MGCYNSPTPWSSSLCGLPLSYGTVEMHVSQNQAELQQAISTRQSPRSTSANDRDDLECRYRQLLHKQIELEQELARCKATIKAQSDIIQKSQPGHKPFPQPSFGSRNAYPLPNFYQTPIPPPQFDPFGTVTAARNTLQQSNSNPGMPHSKPNYGGRSTPRPGKVTHPNGTYEPDSAFEQPFYEQNITPPHMNPYPAPLPGTLGHGLTSEQRAQPLSSFCNTSQALGTLRIQSQASENSYPPRYSQQPPNQPSYPSQIPCPNVPQQYTPSTTPPMSTVLVTTTNTAHELGFSAKFDTLFTMSEQYAFAHINFPSSAKDAMLSSYIKGKWERVAGNSAGNLMSNSQTRYHVVARVINQWISKHVLRRTCFSGLDEEVDANIEVYASSIYQTTPMAVRDQLLRNIAQEIDRLKARPDFPNFFFQRCRDRGNDLWAIVYPMMHRKTSKDWDDMMSLMVEAHNLAGSMFGGPYEWSFAFHEVGAPFQQSMMSNKDPFLRGFLPAELERRGAVVRLGVSPLVGFRTYQNAAMEAGKVNKAIVLTKWPQF